MGDSNFLTTVLMPIALGVIMLGLGLSLTPDDFKRVVRYPRAVLVGLFCQILLLPIGCYGLVIAFGLPPELAVGMMLLAASPGGATANLYSHLSHGDVALNITLTAVNSVLSVVTMPLIVNLSLGLFMDADKTIPLQFAKVMQIFAVVLVPVAIGMVLRGWRPKLSQVLDKPVKIMSVIFLIGIIASAAIKEKDRLGDYFSQVGPAALAFNLMSLAVGYLVPLLVKVPRRQAIAIGMEIGIHNGTLAIAVALSPVLLNNATMAMPAAIYSLIMFITAAGFGFLVNMKKHEEPNRA